MKPIGLQNANTKICESYQDGVSRNNGKQICYDGLLNKGFLFFKAGYYGKASGDEENKWIESLIRPLFFAKSASDSEGWDIRKYSGRNNPNSSSKKNHFFPNIKRWLYGLMELLENNNYPKFEDLKERKIQRCFLESPIALINAKKEIGSVQSQEINNAIKKYGSYLEQQIRLLQPNVIFCCYGEGVNPMIKFLKNKIYIDCESYKSKHKEEYWIHYSKRFNVIIINCCSPEYSSKPELNEKDLYCKTMQEIKDNLSLFDSLKEFDIDECRKYIEDNNLG